MERNTEIYFPPNNELGSFQRFDLEVSLANIFNRVRKRRKFENILRGPSREFRLIERLTEMGYEVFPYCEKVGYHPSSCYYDHMSRSILVGYDRTLPDVVEDFSAVARSLEILEFWSYHNRGEYTIGLRHQQPVERK